MVFEFSIGFYQLPQSIPPTQQYFFLQNEKQIGMILKSRWYYTVVGEE
jgi:hypothetical protein